MDDKSRRPSYEDKYRQVSFSVDLKPEASNEKASPTSGSTNTSTTVLPSPPHKDEPEPPYSVFSKTWKNFVLAFITMTAFISPLTSNVYMSAIPSVAKVRDHLRFSCVHYLC